MIKFIIGLIIFGLIALAIIILVVINFSYKSLRQVRKTVEDQYELHQKRKEQKEKNPFGEDYFKSSNNKQQNLYQKQQRQYSANTANQSNTNAEQPKQQTAQEEEKENAARKTTTDSGVTIIDDRGQDKKIFTHDDGEYVEFEEVHD